MLILSASLNSGQEACLLHSGGPWEDRRAGFHWWSSGTLPTSFCSVILGQESSSGQHHWLRAFGKGPRFFEALTSLRLKDTAESLGRGHEALGYRRSHGREVWVSGWSTVGTLPGKAPTLDSPSLTLGTVICPPIHAILSFLVRSAFRNKSKPSLLCSVFCCPWSCHAALPVELSPPHLTVWLDSLSPPNG